MRSDKYRKKKQIFNVINIVLTLSILVVSGVGIYVATQWEESQIVPVFSSISCVCGGLALILGMLLPPKEKGVQISGDTMRMLTTLNAFLNNHIPAPSLMRQKRVYRSWNYMSMVILSIFVILFGGFTAAFAVVNQHSAAVYIGLIVLWLMLDAGAGFWTYYDAVCTGADGEYGISPEVNGKRVVRRMGKDTLIVLALFGSALTVSYFITMAQHKPAVDIDRIHKEISEAEKSFDALEPEDFFTHEEYDSVSDAVLSLKETYGDTKYYYILQYPGSDKLNIISWTDASERITVDSFLCKEDGSVERKQSFTSSAITKADVAGKQDGTVE